MTKRPDTEYTPPAAKSSPFIEEVKLAATRAKLTERQAALDLLAHVCDVLTKGSKEESVQFFLHEVALSVGCHQRLTVTQLRCMLFASARGERLVGHRNWLFPGLARSVDRTIARRIVATAVIHRGADLIAGRSSFFDFGVAIFQIMLLIFDAAEVVYLEDFATERRVARWDEEWNLVQRLRSLMRVEVELNQR